MVIAHGVDRRLGICDIETMKELFDVGILNPDTGEWEEFEISAYHNDLFRLAKHLTSQTYDYLVTFNGINFDCQVLQYVIDNNQKWFDLTGLEIVEKIYEFAQQTIENSNFGLFPTYKEDKFSIPTIDVFRIHHFDNEARRTSLKWCAFMLNMDVEEMPIHHGQKGLTKEDIQLVKMYRRNDVLVTKAVFLLTLGQTDIEELADYKGKNKIQDRIDIMNESGLLCMNWSDVKIGEEWNKLEYIKSEGITDERKIFPQKVKYPYGQKFKNFFPKTMKFKTQKMRDFVEVFGNHYVKPEKQEFPVTIGETTYTVAKGGIHSTEKNRKVLIPDGWDASDADVGAQYPNAIIKLEIYPPHLKRTIMVNFIGTVDMKDVYKQRGKESSDPVEKSRLKGLETGTKLRMNGGYFGKLGQKGSFLEYPEGLLKVTVANEIEILMLIESMELAGFKVISGNTDGIVTLYPHDKEDLYFSVCAEWEKSVGNDKRGKLEYAKFMGLWQDSINSYIGKIHAKDGKFTVKKKGRFMTEFEINKNKSKRIVPLALEQYFIYGKDPVSFIENHKNIFDFCIGKKATGKMHYEEQWEEQKLIKTKVHKKLVRYFVSKEGTILYKRGLNNEGNPMNNHVNAPTGLGQPKVTYFNKAFEGNYNIDYDYYILETLERMDNIEKTKKAKAFIESRGPSVQMSLF